MAGERRKERCDKKKAIAPTITIKSYESIARLSYICDQAQKTIGESIVRSALNSKDIIESLSSQFVRDLSVGNKVYFGDIKRPALRPPQYNDGEGKRLAMRFLIHTHESLAAVAYALGCPVATATGLLIDQALHRREIVLGVVAKFISQDLDSKRRRQLVLLLDGINANHSRDERVTLSVFLNMLVEECVGGARTIKQVIREYLGE